jgi:hypothetical protein
MHVARAETVEEGGEDELGGMTGDLSLAALCTAAEVCACVV